MGKKLLLLLIVTFFVQLAYADMTNYCGSGNSTSIPPFISSSASPIVMFVMGRDHKLFYEAYNDATDLDGDGTIDIGYKHSINYDGYFDSYKCYTYSSGRFSPTRKTENKYCGGSGEWSGNFLNWLSMTRMDVIRKVLYGGFRYVDQKNLTVLGGAYVPRDAHSWGKEYSAADTRKLTPYEQPSKISCNFSQNEYEINNTSNPVLSVLYADSGNTYVGSGAGDFAYSFSPQNYSSHTQQAAMDRTVTARYYGNMMMVTYFKPSSSNDFRFYLENVSQGGALQVIDTSNGKTLININSGNAAASFDSNKTYKIIVRVRRNTDGSTNMSARVSIALSNGTSKATLSSSISSTTFGRIVGYSTINDSCGLMTNNFIETGVPSTIEGGATEETKVYVRHLFCMSSINQNENHSIRILQNRKERMWQWASVESTVCRDKIDTNNDGTAERAITPTDVFVRVEVCKPDLEETNCQSYGSDAGREKPIGLLQKYGKYSNKTICSKTNSESSSCNTDEGFTVKESNMYFGLLTGSYNNNLAGGVLRKNITSIEEEINSDGTFKSAAPVKGSIIHTLNTMQINDYSYANSMYSCGWGSPANCKSWGNPLGEMYYEALRYLVGKKKATSDYISGISNNNDTGLALPMPGWRDPYADFPPCSPANIIIISDVYPSYDNDNKDEGTELAGFSRKNYLDEISAREGISGNYFIGKSGSVSDSTCAPKNVTSLYNVEGLCPEEPSKQGTYKTSALAYYAATDIVKNKHETMGNMRTIKTHSVALASHIPEIRINTPKGIVTLVPTGWNNSGSKPMLLLDFYTESISPTKGRFRINFEDSEVGGDHDMDSIVKYAYEVNSDGTVTITLTSEYEVGSNNMSTGFVISGTTKDGVYTPINVKENKKFYEETFTPTGTTAGLLKDPLWYAAKYGGGSLRPDGEPENYNFVTNPSELEDKLEKVFKEITKKVSSGTAVSLSKTKNKERILNQGVFYPEKSFGFGAGKLDITWVGKVLTYWFFENDLYQNMLEDTNKNRMLDLGAGGDKIIEFHVDNDTETLTIDKYTSTSLGAIGEKTDTETPFDDVAFLWDSGNKLASASASSRKIYTNVDGELVEFVSAQANKFSADLGILSETCLKNVNNLIFYIRGQDVPGCRPRTYTDSNGVTETYKLGDILNSSPVMVDYPKKSGRPGYIMSYVGANDGMLHAFRAGKFMSYSGRKMMLCDDTMSCNGSELGQEEWAFIPKNALPYLRYLADPGYCHMYYNDLTPYIIEEDTNKDGYVDKRILIGGMRLGGACGQGTLNPPADTCADKSSADCVGFSSYYALDITNQNNPVLLWEFSDPYLGFSFSGPAYIKRGDNRYIMFLSGPTSYDGSVDQSLGVFVLELEKTFALKSGGVHKYSGETRKDFLKLNSLGEFTNSFGGKLFTKGVDFNGNGITDTVFFGISQYKNNKWIGNVLGLKIVENNPDTWVFNTLFNSSYSIGKPVTTMIQHMKCFKNNFLYFGTGRWFYKTDETGASSSDINYLYGIRIDGCKDGNCDFTSSNMKTDLCVNATSDDKFFWRRDMRPKNTIGKYYMERLIADPATTVKSNVVIFSSTLPDDDVCSFGGKHSTWAINCATGTNAAFDCKNNRITNIPSVLVPTTAGNIINKELGGSDNGFPPIELGAALGEPTSLERVDGTRKGRLLFWIEK